jgi:hypothetical protein
MKELTVVCMQKPDVGRRLAAAVAAAAALMDCAVHKRIMRASGNANRNTGDFFDSLHPGKG